MSIKLTGAYVTAPSLMTVVGECNAIQGDHLGAGDAQALLERQVAHRAGAALEREVRGQAELVADTLALKQQCALNPGPPCPAVASPSASSPTASSCARWRSST